MIRSNVRVCGRLVLSAALSWLLIPVANAEAPPAPTIVETSTQTTPSSGAASSEADSEAQSPADSSSDTPTESPSEESSSPADDTASAAPAGAAEKNLNTIPEDGMGNDTWMSGATRLVREILQKRPNEDLVICIGGCVDRMGRVVFAQAAEVTPKAPEASISKAAPAPDAPALIEPAAAVNPVIVPVPLTATKSPDAAQETQPAIAPAAKATAASEMKTPGFVPSMARPVAADPTAARPEAKASGTDQPK